MNNIKTIKDFDKKPEISKKHTNNKNIYLKELQKISKENYMKYSYDYDKAQFRKEGTINIEVVCYKNGFIVSDENKIRNYTSPKNSDFINSVNNQKVPNELK